nr:MAG TPA: hypothetical protein [Caudoviricetes sp.]
MRKADLKSVNFRTANLSNVLNLKYYTDWSDREDE